MGAVAQFLVIIVLMTMMTGCKLATIVVEGGKVESAFGNCVAGNICIIEVTDTNFAESFHAEADEGWCFQGWNKGNGFFCGGSAEPFCNLSFTDHEEELEHLVASSETFYLMPLFREISVPIWNEEREWLQPIDFVGYSYKQIAAVCPPPSGECSGSLNGRNLTGYIWASEAEIIDLYRAFCAEPPYDATNAAYPFLTGSLVVHSDFFEHFEQTDGRSFPEGGRILTGLLREPNSLAKVDGYFGDHHFGFVSGSLSASENIGAWFWRPL